MKTNFQNARAFTLFEALLALATVAALSVMGIVVYASVMERVRNNEAISDIYLIESLIARYDVKNGGLPDSLADTDAEGMLDPWDNAYQYQNLADAPHNPAGKPMVPHRKDKFLNPINTDYDLYSMGKDGKSKLPLPPKDSRDDIIRANDGAFIGLAEDF